MTDAARRWPLMGMGPDRTGRPQPRVGMLAFPGLTLIDLVGPQAVLNGPMRTHLLWKTTDPVESDSGISITPTMRFDDAPDRFDILFVPGGPGQAELFGDAETLDFLARQGAGADWVTSVCTGSLILGAAGLLDGYRAATHWAARDLLPLFGAEPVAERVVIDRNRITGGGVTAGIDFALTLLVHVFGEAVARTTQLLMEYDPAPPVHAGNVGAAGPEIAMAALAVLGPVAEMSMAALQARADRFEG